MILVLGGARSGKSRYAVERARQAGDRVLFCATAEARDDDMRERIRRHRTTRPPGWGLVEEPSSPAAALAREESDAWDVVIVDCVTLLVSNLLLEDGDGPVEGGTVPAGDRIHAEVEDRIHAEVDRLVVLLDQQPWVSVVVSNEVGAGVVPGNRLARTFRDVLGAVNQRIAGSADEIVMMVAGIPVAIDAGEGGPGA